MKPRIVIADDHRLILVGLRKVLEENGYNVVAEFTNGLSCLNYILSHPVDAVICDIEMPGRTGLEIIKEAQGSGIKFITVTFHKEEYFFSKAMSAGARGHLLKENALAEIVECIDTVLAGKIYVGRVVVSNLIYLSASDEKKLMDVFTKSERRILSLLAANKTTKEIAQILFLSERTVGNQRYNIGIKLKQNQVGLTLKDWVKKNVDSLIS